jgi:lipid-A-disaccharide synthase
LDLWFRKHQDRKVWLDIRITQGNAAECLVAADAGLIKSGTSTLEAGLLRCPHVVVYRPSLTTKWIFRYLIRYRGPIGLVNLVADWKPGEDYLVPEILCEDVTPKNLSQEMISLFSHSNRRQKMEEGFELLRKKVLETSDSLSPSVCAAREVLTILNDLGKR